jgi:aryl-alcohol dehydrogenase-like predicted oxidoreductase
MEKRALGKTEMDISIITFGGIIVDKLEAAQASEYVSEAYDKGVNYYDVAPSYGNSQYVLGPALEPYRKDVYLACKTGMRTAPEAQAELEESLRALKTDYFDLYQLHGLDEPEEIKTVFAPGGAMEVLVRAKEKGLARHIGFTCHRDASALEIMRNYAGFATMLFPVNFAYHIEKSGGIDALKAANEREMGVIAIKALARRSLAEGEERPYPRCWYHPILDDPELSRLALNYTLSQQVSTAVPPGDIRLFRLALELIGKQNGKCVPLAETELATLKAEAAKTEHVLFS